MSGFLIYCVLKNFFFILQLPQLLQTPTEIRLPMLVTMTLVFNWHLKVKSFAKAEIVGMGWRFLRPPCRPERTILEPYLPSTGKVKKPLFSYTRSGIEYLVLVLRLGQGSFYFCEKLRKGGKCQDGVAFFEAALQAGTDDFRTLSAIYR